MFSAARRSVSSLLRIRNLSVFSHGKILHRGRTEQHLKAALVKKPKEMWNQSDIISKIDRTRDNLMFGISLLFGSFTLALYLIVLINGNDTTASKNHNEIKRN